MLIFQVQGETCSKNRNRPKLKWIFESLIFLLTLRTFTLVSWVFIVLFDNLKSLSCFWSLWIFSSNLWVVATFKFCWIFINVSCLLSFSSCLNVLPCSIWEILVWEFSFTEINSIRIKKLCFKMVFYSSIPDLLYTDKL